MRKIFIITLLLVLLGSLSFGYTPPNINIEINEEPLNFTEDSGRPFIENSRTLVPLRIVTESLGLEVNWNNELREAVVSQKDTTVRVPIDASYIYKNNNKIKNDSKAIIKDKRTYLPIRVVLEAFDYNVGWDQDSWSVLVEKSKTNPITNISQKITIGDDTLNIIGYKVDLNNSNLEVKTALAKNSVGKTDTMQNIAKENDAILAINGSYFAAYDEDDIKDPYGILAVDGEVVHNANKRATIGFKDGKVDIDRIDTEIKGHNGEPVWKYSWNGYWLNHSVLEGGPSLIVYNEKRGEETNTFLGKNYIVEDGFITKEVDNQSVKIPKDGYVVNLYGQLGVEPGQVYDRFAVGYPFNYSVKLKPSSGDEYFWNNVDYATGAGPALILDGEISIDYERENFTEKKVIEYSWTRSAIGYTKNNELILITTNATIPELAQIMQKLGCYEAMNLDGGASSGIFYNDSYIWEPGRDLSNIIYIQ